MKLTAIISLVLIGVACCRSALLSRRHRREATAGAAADPNPGGAFWASALSCDSCGRECASSCGTRHFRTCCFNYLRRKRAPLSTGPPAGLKLQLWLAKNSQGLEYNRQDQRLPVFLENIPDLPMSAAGAAFNEMDSVINEDPLESSLQLIYDA